AQPFTLSGYAFDATPPTGNGVPFVHIYAYPAGGAPPIFIGAPYTGVSRPDLGAWFQDSRYSSSGWTQSVSGLAPGAYYFGVYPYRSDTWDFGEPRGRWITVQ